MPLKVQFLTPAQSSLALENENGAWLEGVKRAFTARAGVLEVFDPEEADAIIINERVSFKVWRYIRKLEDDPIVGRFPQKTYTINGDDAATGLLRGLYTCLDRIRFDARFHRLVPYVNYPNDRILASRDRSTPTREFLASWRGNPKPNLVRRAIVRRFARNPRFRVETTQSWFTHDEKEKDRFIDLLLSSKFSLCPAGYAPTSYRIYESMALGIAPVILAKEIVLPLGPDWAACSIHLNENEVAQLEAILEKRESEWEKMGNRARMEWERFFSPEKVYDYHVDALLDLIKNSPKSSREAEQRRWNSFRMYVANRWTIPQRLVSRGVVMYIEAQNRRPIF